MKGASAYKPFNEIEIGDDFRKFMKTLELNYSKAPLDVYKRQISALPALPSGLGNYASVC